MEQTATSPLITYLNDPTLKARLLAEIRAHEEADHLVQGYGYGRMNGHFRGCAIGCALHALNTIRGADALHEVDAHRRYETELGLPIWLAYLEDHLFERLPAAAARQWPRRFAEAVPVGAVVSDRVLAQILRWTLADDRWGVRHVTDDVEVRAVVDRMATLFDREIVGDSPSRQEWDEAARDARAVWAARAARVAWAARDAWVAWDASAIRGAWVAWDSRVARVVRDARAAMGGATARAFSGALAEHVLALLRALPVATEPAHHSV